MTPTAPAATPTTSNTNLPYGGFGQASSDAGLASNILSFLPTQEAQTARVNPSDTSMLPTVNPSYTTFGAPSAPVINPGAFGENLTGYNEATQKAMSGLTSGENSAYQEAMNQYEKNMAQFGNLTGVYNTLANTYGLPGYQQDINTLQGLLQNLTQDINARTTMGGGLMTSAARDEAEAIARNPLDLALSNASREYQTGQSNVSNVLGAYETSLTNALKPEELNISNMPTLFGQTNQAAQSGYEQGATAIQNMIANRQRQEEIAAQQEQANAFMKEVNAQYGGGNLANTFETGSTGSSQFKGVSFKNPSLGPTGGYAFNVDGRPVSAVTWAAQNGQSPSAVIAYMAQNGDNTAGSAYQALLNNPNMSLFELEQKFPSLAWGAAPIPESAPVASAPTPQAHPDLMTQIFGTQGTQWLHDIGGVF